MISILYAIPYLGARFGGPVVSLRSIAYGVVESGGRVTVLSCVEPGDGEAVPFDSRVTVRVSPARAFFGYRASPWLQPLIEESVSAGVDVIHSHGLWTDLHRRIARVAEQKKVPHLISPCGMLAPGALRRCRMKKLPAQKLFQEKALRNAACLHATSTKELDEIRGYGLGNPVAVIPLPVDRLSASAKDCDAFMSRHGLQEGIRYVLFLGRVHPVKGIHHLLDAWRALYREYPQWRLVIAGPEDKAYRDRLDGLIRNSNAGESVRFIGPLAPREKWAAFKIAKVFVMPSDFENYGLAIAEAATAGLAIIASTGTPWKALQDKGAGWWIPNTPSSLRHALDQALSVDASVLTRMGEKARHYMSHFSSEAIAREFMKVYAWLVSGSERPDCVNVTEAARYRNTFGSRL